MKLTNEEEIIKAILVSIGSFSDAKVLNGYITKYAQNYTAEDILAEREKRVYEQEKLIKKYKSSFVCIRVNYPGVLKNDCVSIGIMKIICDTTITVFKDHILYKSFDITAEGPMLTIILNKLGYDTKKKTIEIEENHPLGRFVDIDVYDKYNKSLSRKDLGLDSRRCYICEDYAHICVRQRKHSEKEIKNFIKISYNSFYKLQK